MQELIIVIASMIYLAFNRSYMYIINYVRRHVCSDCSRLRVVHHRPRTFFERLLGTISQKLQ